MSINDKTNPELFPDLTKREIQKGYYRMLHKAIHFGGIWHDGQDRKYLQVPYICHPIGVMEIVRSVTANEPMLCAAVLHDVVEDTSTTNDTIRKLFGDTVAELVYWLTDKSKPEDGNRATRKAIDRAHTAAAPAEAQTIKLADLIHNADSIIKYDPDFSVVFMREFELLLNVLHKGDATLHDRASVIVTEYQNSLLQEALR